MIKEDDLEDFDLEKMLSEIEKTPRIVRIWWGIETFFQDHFTLRAIKNNIKWFIQRRKRGFDDKELWSLDDSFYKWFYPRLKAFSEKELMGYPSKYGSADHWKKILKMRVTQLEQIMKCMYCEWVFEDGLKYLSEDELKKIKEDYGNNKQEYDRTVSLKGFDKMYEEFMQWFAEDCGNLWD